MRRNMPSGDAARPRHARLWFLGRSDARRQPVFLVALPGRPARRRPSAGRPARPMADLDDEVDTLYGLPLDEFVAERDALSKRLRADKRREDANAVKALRKPSVAAWAPTRCCAANPGSATRCSRRATRCGPRRRTCLPGAATPPRRGRRARRSGARWATSSRPRAGWPARAGSRRPPCLTACVRRCTRPPPTTRRGPRSRPRGSPASAGRRRSPGSRALRRRRRRPSAEHKGKARTKKAKAADDDGAERERERQAAERDRRKAAQAELKEARAAERAAARARREAEGEVHDAERLLSAARGRLEKAEKAERDAAGRREAAEQAV